MGNIFRNRFQSLHAVLLAVFFSLMAAQPAVSQVKVTVSDQIVSVKGEKMYVHNVKKGETIYSICKAYNITADDLQRQNPAIGQGLKEGQLLYIPVVNLSGYRSDNYIEHKVRRMFEDLDYISEKYGVPKEDIMAFNNMESESLKKIKRLKIPIRKDGSAGLTPENPETPDPQNTEITATDTVNVTGTTYPEDGETDIPKTYRLPEIDKAKTRTVALLLPLNVNGKPNANYMDFYSGALMALEQIKLAGGNIKLNVLDYGNDINTVAQSEKIKEADLIIGPIRYEAMKEMTDIANELRIPIVSPLDAAVDSLLEDCPYLFQAALNQRRQAEAMADMVMEEASKAPNPNILIVYNPSGNEAPFAQMLKEALEEKGASISAYGSSGVLSALRKDMDNIVIVQTYTEGLTAEILRQIDIKMLPAEKITLFGTPKWKGFEAIDMSLYFKYNTKICMPYNVDLGREDVRQFIRAYRSLYNCEPRANAFSGYDIVYFFCNAVLNGLQECAEDPDNTVAYSYMQKNLLQLDMLQQKLRFVKNPEGGYVNTAATKITFNPDYSVTSVQD